MKVKTTLMHDIFESQTLSSKSFQRSLIIMSLINNKESHENVAALMIILLQNVNRMH